MIVATQNARDFGADEIIVSKTDPTGRIIYVNETFQRISMMTESEVLGKPHNLIRHPDMPKCIFKLLWQTISQGKEIFAYVKNIASNGDYYWVFAHVTPSFDSSGSIIGYHSNRRCPEQSTLNIVIALYKLLLEEEKRHSNSRDGMEASYKMLVDLMDAQNMEYSEFVFSLDSVRNVDDLTSKMNSFRKAS